MKHEERWSSLDPRSLALFRILLGATLLLDLASRLPWLKEFYTDQGVLPRSVLARSEFLDQWLCFHLGFGDWWGLFGLFLLQASLAIALLVGWHTRPVVLLNWLLLNSLHVRNPFLNDRGDMELALLLFWSFFLPLGACWSLDARQGRTATTSHKGLAATCLVVQLALIYLCAGFLKYGEFWLARGDGLYHSLQSPLFATPLAGILLNTPGWFLTALNYLIVAAEVFVGFLLLTPRSVPLLRGLAVGLVVSFHLAVALLFHLGLFPWIGIVGVVALVPGGWWEVSLWRRFARSRDGRMPELPYPATEPFARRAFLGLCLFLVVLCNLATRAEGEAFQRPDWAIKLSAALRLEQHWDLFSPHPPFNGVFQVVDADTGEATVVLPDPDQKVNFPSHRWRMLMIASLFPRFALVRAGVAEALSPPGRATLYQFRVSLVDSNGESKPFTIWTLWRTQERDG